MTRAAASAPASGSKPSAPGDSFISGASKSAAPLRPGSSAVTFIQRFESQLHLAPAVREQRAKLMKSSQLYFFRANPALFAMDLKHAYDASLLGRQAPTVTIGGDTHLSNFGVVRGPKGDPVWTLNDFDQVRTGNPEADLERLATGAVLLARHQGWKLGDQRKLAEKIAEAYAKAVEHPGDPWMDQKDASGPVQAVVDRASQTTRSDFLARWSKGSHFTLGQSLKAVPPGERSAVEAALAEYGKSLPKDAELARPIEVLDVARRVDAGGSTFGLERFYALVKGDGGKQPRILELKQLLPGSPPSAIAAQSSALTGVKSPLLGEAEISGTKVLVRELEPEKQRLELTTLHHDEIETLAKQAAQVLAHAHARGHAKALKEWIGDDQDALKASLGDFALRYANQVHDDFATFSRQS